MTILSVPESLSANRPRSAGPILRTSSSGSLRQRRLAKRHGRPIVAQPIGDLVAELQSVLARIAAGSVAGDNQAVIRHQNRLGPRAVPFRGRCSASACFSVWASVKPGSTYGSQRIESPKISSASSLAVSCGR